MAGENRDLVRVRALRLAIATDRELRRLAHADDRPVGAYLRRLVEQHVSEREPMRAGANREH